ncbi:MAG TPA: hypothetical protein VHI52_10770, partial [Verrucomicrobiae bacterium]|nr:hypothetical protein [Verrucomicrobiae bacterium]
VERTFDGKHPCCLCKAVAEGKKSEKRADTILQLKKFDALSQSITISLVCPASFPPATRVGQLMRLRLYPPPTPPPLAV